METEKSTICNIPKLSTNSSNKPINMPLVSLSQKINESVMFGSVFSALTAKFFTAQDLMEWLTTVSFDDSMNIAYKAVCINIHPNKQYLHDSSHFLMRRPQYSCIAFGYGLNPYISDHAATDKNPIIAHICEDIITFRNNPNIIKYCSLVLAGQGTSQYIHVRLLSCYKARNFPNLNISANEINKSLVEADWTEKFRYNELLAMLILKRVIKLQKDAPIYYGCVAYESYYKVVKKMYVDKLLTQLTRDDLSLLNNFFPGIIDGKIFTYDALAYKIAMFGNDIAGYILGFPIQNMIPSDKQIHTAIDNLTKLGITKYAEYIRKYIRSTYIPSVPTFTDPDIISLDLRENSKFVETNILVTVDPETVCSNDQDVLMESIDDYVPFDVVSYQVGTNIHRLTRPEFETIAKSKKNPWTNDWIPCTVMSTIKARVEAAEELGLPPSRILADMLTRVENDTLFDPDEIPESEAQSDPVPPHALIEMLNNMPLTQGEHLEFQGQSDPVPPLIRLSNRSNLLAFWRAYIQQNEQRWNETYTDWNEGREEEDYIPTLEDTIPPLEDTIPPPPTLTYGKVRVGSIGNMDQDGSDVEDEDEDEDESEGESSDIYTSENVEDDMYGMY